MSSGAKFCRLEGKEEALIIWFPMRRMVKRAVFQSTASMLFPALTIHSVVKCVLPYARPSVVPGEKS